VFKTAQAAEHNVAATPLLMLMHDVFPDAKFLVVHGAGVDSGARASGSLWPMWKCKLDATVVQREICQPASTVSPRYCGSYIWP